MYFWPTKAKTNNFNIKKEYKQTILTVFIYFVSNFEKYYD